MSHHFDTPTALEDPRLNICDFYLFRGVPGTVVMAMTVNPDAGLSAPDTFREEGIYAFRFDLDGDRTEEVTFKFRFSAPTHADDDVHRHIQTFELRRATGPDALQGIDGEVIASGRSGAVISAENNVCVFAGLAPDLFAGDGAALGAFRNALFQHNRFAPEAFQSRKNFFAGRNVSAIVLEVPVSLIGQGLVHSWATVSLHGHAPEVQVSRWGLPLVTNVFMPEADMKERFNRTTPRDDQQAFIDQVERVAEQLTRLSGSAASPAAYAKRLSARLFPAMLPYWLDTPAAFDFAGFNGRALTDDVMDVILTLATNSPLGDGVVPPKEQIRKVFPYFAEPFTAADQAGLAPSRPPTKPAGH